MRELVTIGDLGSFRTATPLGRSRGRRVQVLQGIGATIVGWSPPAAVNMNSVGVPLQNAAIALQNYLDANGIPNEATDDPNVAAFQQAWNADGVAGVSPIDVDGGYGPNTTAALNALTGQAAPPGGGGIVPVTPAPVVPGSTPASGAGFPWGAAILVGGILAGGYFFFLRKKKRTSFSVTTHANPRRRGKKKNGRRGAKKGGRRK